MMTKEATLLLLNLLAHIHPAAAIVPVPTTTVPRYPSPHQLRNETCATLLRHLRYSGAVDSIEGARQSGKVCQMHPRHHLQHQRIDRPISGGKVRVRSQALFEKVSLVVRQEEILASARVRPHETVGVGVRWLTCNGVHGVG
jgi:hypothetical protein